MTPGSYNPAAPTTAASELAGPDQAGSNPVAMTEQARDRVGATHPVTEADPATNSISDANIRTIAIIGAGTAGRSFALAVACAGFHVILEDVMPANLRKAEADFADMGHRAGPGRLSLALTVEAAVREADLAIDFVPDELESKLEIFSMIDRMAPPRTILCTPSEALSITDLASCVYRPDRCFALRGSLLPGPVQPGNVLSGEVLSREVASDDGPSDNVLPGRPTTPVRLLHPASFSPSVLASTATFLRSLGLVVQTEVDPDPPTLMKNLAPSIPTRANP